jgi:hypothetical protein
LLLVALLLARQKWGLRGKNADLIMTCGVAVVILVAVSALTPRPSVAQGFDRAAHRAFSTYCSGHSSAVTEIMQLLDPPSDRKQGPRDESREAENEPPRPGSATVLRIPFEMAPIIDAGMAQNENNVSLGISRRTRRKVSGEFCEAVGMYIALRATDG